MPNSTQQPPSAAALCRARGLRNTWRGAHRRRATTLIELCIVMAIMVFVMSAVGLVMVSSSSAIQVHTARGTLQFKLAEAIDRIAVELGQTGTNCPNWNLTSSSITFNICQGFDGAQQLWGPAITYRRTLDGKLQREQGGSSSTLMGRLNALQFQQNGSLVSVSLTAEEQSAEQQMLSAPMSATVFLND